MMLVYQQKEFLLLVLQSFLCGVALGGVYDIFRISRLIMGLNPFSDAGVSALSERNYPLIGRIRTAPRRILGAGNILLFFEDILFMLIATAAILILLFFRNDGKFRLIVILLALLGFLCYYISIGRIVIRFSAFIVFLLKLIWAYAVFILLFPIKCALRLISRLWRAVLARIRLRYASARILRDGRAYLCELVTWAGAGFPDEFQNKQKRRSNAVYHKKSGGIKNAKNKAEKKV